MIRKPIHLLTETDLNQIPAWEYVSGEESELEQDESTVSPLKPDEPVSIEGDFWIRTEFRLACGKNFLGLVNFVRDRDEIIRINGDDYFHASKQPFIVTQSEQAGFYFGAAEPKSNEIELIYEALGVSGPNDVFPVTYRSE